MTLGIGGSTVAQELSRLERPSAYQPITVDERLTRIEKAQRLMFDQGIDALFLEATTSLVYFTCLLYTSPSPRDISGSRMPSSA